MEISKLKESEFQRYTGIKRKTYNRPIAFVLHINFIELSKINRIFRQQKLQTSFDLLL